MTVKKGDIVKIDYVGTFEDGKEFDSSKKHGTPLEFQVGSGMVIKGLDDAIVGMKKDEEKNIKIEPEQAYGHHNPELIKKVPREQMPKDHEIKEGMMLAVALPTGQQIPATVKEVGEKEVTIDLNSPLVGKTLNFNIKLLEIKESGDVKKS